MNALRNSVLLDFEDLFPDIEPKPIESYLSGIGKNMLIQTVTHLLSFQTHGSKFDSHREFLSHFFQQANNDFANQIYQQIKACEKKDGKPGLIINSYSSLRLFEIVSQMLEEDEIKDSASFERDVFQAYLVVNSWQNESELIPIESTAHLPFELKMPMITMCTMFPDFDFTTQNLNELWISQTIKAISLFKYLEEATNTSHLLDKFLKYFGCGTWQEYIKRFMPLSFSVIKAEKESHIDIIIEDETNADQVSFIEKLILLEGTPMDDVDFRPIRSNPLYKIDNGKYRIIFNVFIIEKLFKGLYFMLNQINEQLSGSEKIKNFRSQYCDHFSERTLFYTILKRIFNANRIQFSGQEIKEMGVDAEPDFYVRKGNKLFLFESKDILINSSIKRGRDYNVYEKVLHEKLYYESHINGKSAKAVLQLINNIERVLLNEFSFDDKYYYKDIHVYPILVLHDHQFNIPGLNVLINHWFQIEIESLRKKGLFTQRIRPIVIVPMDFFILHQDLIQSNIKLFVDLLENHYNITSDILLKRKQIRSEGHLEEVMNNIATPFILTGHNYLEHLKIRRTPEMLKEYGLTLFEDK